MKRQEDLRTISLSLFFSFSDFQQADVFLLSCYDDNDIDDDMCTGKCSRFVAIALYPLALLSIICNIVLFFPGGEVIYAQEKHITTEVSYMGGLIGGGVLVSFDPHRPPSTRRNIVTCC